MGHNINSEHICQSVPKCVDINAAFLVNTSNLGNRDDVKCDDNGSWLNNGVRKLYLDVVRKDAGSLLSVDTVKRGGNPPPQRKHWCLVRTYFLCKASKDFKKVIASLQGIRYNYPYN